MPRTRIPVPKFPIGRCTWQKFEPSERVALLEKTLKAKHGISFRCFPGEEEEYQCEDYSLFSEWESALLQGEPLWAVYAKFHTFLSWLDVHWVRQDQTKDWVGQEKESFLGTLGAVTSDRILLAHLSVGVAACFDRNGRHVTKCQLCSYTCPPKSC